MVPDPLAQGELTAMRLPVLRMRFLPVAVLTAAVAVAGCGEEKKNCQGTCTHVYDPAQCNVVVPGQPFDDLRDECTSECQAALREPGEMGDYNPYERAPSGSDWENYTLANERQAAEWMECVWSQPCENLTLQAGICWPIP